MSFIGEGIQGLSDLAQKYIYNPLGEAESKVGHALTMGASPDPNAGSGVLNNVSTNVKGEQALGKPGGIFGNAPHPKPESFGQAVDAYLAPYVSDLTSLGPEYGAEMAFLKPYMEGNPGAATETAVAKEYGGSGVKDTSTSTPQSEALDAATAAQAKEVESQTSPGFGAIGKAAVASEATVPYTDILNAALQGLKNQFMGYSTTPQFASLNTSSWGPSMQALYNYIANAGSSAGGGSVLGSPTIAASGAPTSAGSTPSTTNLGVTTTPTTVPTGPYSPSTTPLPPETPTPNTSSSNVDTSNLSGGGNVG